MLISYVVNGIIESETANVFLKMKPTFMNFSFTSECNHYETLSDFSGIENTRYNGPSHIFPDRAFSAMNGPSHVCTDVEKG